MAYREKLCKSGFGPYRGLNVPSSGFVAAYAMLSSDLCKSLDVYGFGVKVWLAGVQRITNSRRGGSRSNKSSRANE